MHMDRVRVLLKNEAKTGKRREGTVIEILERVNKEIVGTFQRERDYGFILCDNQKFSKDIYISPKNSKRGSRWRQSCCRDYRLWERQEKTGR